MIRFAELAMFVAPALALVMWRVAAARGMDGPPPRQLAFMLAGLVVLEVALVLIAVRDRMPPGRYVPAAVVDGRIVPGHMEPLLQDSPRQPQAATGPVR